MACRIDANTEWWTRTTGLPEQTAFTIMGWVRIASDLNYWGTFFRLAIAAGTSNLNFGVDSTGLRLELFNSGDSSDSLGTTLALNTWYHLALVGDTASATGYLNGSVDVSHGSNVSIGTVGRLDIGATAAGISPVEYINGRFAAVKIWDAALTLPEIRREMWQVVPVRKRHLNSWFPMLASLAVASGSLDAGHLGRHLTPGGTPTVEEDPPIPWMVPRRRLPGDVFTAAPGGTTYPGYIGGGWW